MAIFVLLAEKPTPTLSEVVDRLYPDNYKLVPDTQWLIDAQGTARTIGDALGIREGQFGKVFIVQAALPGVGWHGKSVWDWLGSKAAKS